MVRFSDMLGGGEDSQAPPAPTAPVPEPPAAEVPEADETTADATPEELLDRLTQYAAEHSPEPETETPAAEPATAVMPPAPVSAGDDLLPRTKSRKRR